MEIRELRAFIATVEHGGFSAAARYLHLSQPALSQTVNTLERQLGVTLLVRSSTGVTATEAGLTLLAEARAVLARHDQAVSAMLRLSESADSTLRVGVPLELPSALLPRALSELSGAYPATRVTLRQLSTSAQLTALKANELDVALLRERPPGNVFDAVSIASENLGVLLARDRALELADPQGIRLEDLANFAWIGFARSGSPAWYDEVTAVLRGHGLDPGAGLDNGELLIAEVKLAAVQSGTAFTLAPEYWSQPIPETVTWSPLVGNPLVRRTWVAWDAASRRRDLAFLVAALESATAAHDG